VADTKVQSLEQKSSTSARDNFNAAQILDRMYVPSINTFLILSFLDVWKYAQKASKFSYVNVCLHHQ
jgi:hypothetical protein